MWNQTRKKKKSLKRGHLKKKKGHLLKTCVDNCTIDRRRDRSKPLDHILLSLMPSTKYLHLNGVPSTLFYTNFLLKMEEKNRVQGPTKEAFQE